MTVRTDVLGFLRESADFIGGATDADVWVRGLESFAIPSIETHGDRRLRPAQLDAWRGLASNRAGLILGPPGSGKTYLLSWLIAGFREARRQAGLPARVLVTAFTRNAIGNVLDAVAALQNTHQQGAPAPAYLGDPPASGISAAVDALGRGGTDEAIARIAAGDCVIGMTVWALYRMLESKPLGGDGRTAPLFDLICIDEASQMVLGHGLMALAGLAANGRVVVAGDDQQLPPIRAGRSVLIEDRELGGSLYTFMKSVGAPEFALNETFRLNAPLTHFPERMFYPNRYVSMSDRRLGLRENWEDGLDLLQRVSLHPDFPVVVLLHDGPTSATLNHFEVGMATKLAEALSSRISGSTATSAPADFWTRRLAIVSPHRAQNAAIRSLLAPSIREGAFVETVDRIQGKEREAVILSYCVADAEFALTEGEFIFSAERLNVATTRAESKLIVLVSRRLLEAVPTDQELLDKAEILREFVFSCEKAADTNVIDSSGRSVPVEIRVRGFAAGEPDIDLSADANQPAATVSITPLAEGVLDMIRIVANESAHGNAPLSTVKNRMALPKLPQAEAALLHRLGWVSLEEKKSQRGLFLVATPFAAQRVVYAPDIETVRLRLDMVVREARSSRHCYYDRVRDRFGWMGDDGRDILMPVMAMMADEGLITFGATGDRITVAMCRSEVEVPVDSLPPIPDLADDDFPLLNTLEDMEAKRINFGVFDTWTSLVELATAAGVPIDATAVSLSRLQAKGHVMLADEGRVRSRMAELARELKHVKQRFESDDAGRRPYLIRSLKVELRDRAKPRRSIAVEEAIAGAVDIATPSQRRALSGIGRMLRADWGETATLAGFQAAGIRAIMAGWNGIGTPTIAIAADTGSGKTEAAALPLIAGAIADRLDGIEGTRAILAYPRVRLAANQAQRLAGYLAACALDDDLPMVTLGLQVSEVPQNFDNLGHHWGELWRKAGPNSLTFPFFACPACSRDLTIRPGEGTAGADRLRCTECTWEYAGWIGSKRGLRDTPPALFLPTTDSLHQWMHNPSYGRIFGDDALFAPPRAILADEIHLYTHVHGAQVGLTLSRLAARSKTSDPDRRDMLAIGMSATISDPARAWRRLIGREEVVVVTPGQGDSRPNPKGREYFYFLQPEVESRGADIAGASTTIQALMCLGHGMRRRTGQDGGFRSLVFFDSIDKMRRLHSAYLNAEDDRNLAAFRTAAYGDDATGSPQTQCCRDPVACDRFADGECWWFGATDDRQCGARGLIAPGQPLRVAGSPIFSGTSGNAEKLVKDADVVFATSSLEVGYDDPDMTLVYQHYAPMNLASFVQRKGRGGRGADDRPITAITLSIYSPRDSWWFRRPADMVSPKNFDTPINPENAYVRRAQALSSLLDGLSRRQRQTGAAFNRSTFASPAALAAAGVLVEAAFGAGIWIELDVADAADLWRRAARDADLSECRSIPDVRHLLEWAPNALFDTINLPSLDVLGPEVGGGSRQDIALAMGTLAPGNATRRYHPHIVHWIPIVQGHAPWLTPGDYSHAERQTLRQTSDELLAELPVAQRSALAAIETDLCRPRTMSVERLGRLAGTTWFGDVGYRPGRANTLGVAEPGDPTVRHDSRGELSGFLLVAADSSAATEFDHSGLNAAERVEVFRTGLTHRQDSGLRVARVYWGADAEIRFDDRTTQPETYAQIFVHPTTGNPLLHGYEVTTEGLRLHLDSARLDRAVQTTVERMAADEPERRWRAAQFARFLIESRARAMGVNAYEAKRGADLLVAAAGDSELRPELVRLRRFWDPSRLKDLLERTREKVLSRHPLMTIPRVQRTGDAISSDAFRELLVRSLDEVADEEAMRGYLRSTMVHGMALRLRIWAAFVGSGDEGRMFAHARLPIQFGADAHDIVTIAEAGSYGDGTIRAVAERWDQARDLWEGGFLGQCANSDEDLVLRRFWAMRARHDHWRNEDGRDRRSLARIAAEISPQVSGSALPASIIRILYGVETAGSETFALYDIAADLEDSRARLAERMGREPSEWEIASGAVRDATTGEAPEMQRLVRAYEELGGTSEEAFSPESRLADQAFRLGTPLCRDGCRACVHQSSDLMGDSLVQSSTSRELLQLFLSV